MSGYTGLRVPIAFPNQCFILVIRTSRNSKVKASLQILRGRVCNIYVGYCPYL